MDDPNYIPGYSYDPVTKKHFRLVNDATLLPQPIPIKKRARYDCRRKRKLQKDFKDNDNLRNSLKKVESLLHPSRAPDLSNNLCWWTAIRQMDSSKNNLFQNFVKRRALISPTLQQKQMSIVRYCVGYQLRSHFCQFLLTDNDNEHIVGIWKNGNGVSQWIHTLTVDPALKYDLRNDMWRNDFVPFSVNYHRLDIAGEITAMCWAESRQKNSVLLSVTEQQPRNSHSFLYNLNSSRDPNDRISMYKPGFKTNLGKDAIFSCAYSEQNQKMAFGLEHRGLITDSISSNYKIYLPKVQDRFHSMTFNDDGQILYNGSGKGALYTTDLRLSPSKHFVASCFAAPALICALHLLNNQRQIIVSGFQDFISLLDLRMLKMPVVKYLEHQNGHRKIPITVNEELGVFCSAGQDKITRIWDIRNSSPIRTFNPPSTGLSDIDIPVATFQTSWKGKFNTPAIFIAYSNYIFMYHV